jgi:hypothetical protein
MLSAHNQLNALDNAEKHGKTTLRHNGHENWTSADSRKWPKKQATTAVI